MKPSNALVFLILFVSVLPAQGCENNVKISVAELIKNSLATAKAKVEAEYNGVVPDDNFDEKKYLNLTCNKSNYDESLLKVKFIIHVTNDSKYAAYMNLWVAKVERVGRENYPSKLLTQKLCGKVLVDVSINNDGSLKSTNICRSSGNKTVDNIVVGIIHKSAPFLPFPKEIKDEIDVMHIIRYVAFGDPRYHNKSLKVRDTIKPAP